MKKNLMTYFFLMFFAVLSLSIQISFAEPLEPIKIGGIFSLTSYGANWGTSEMNANKMAIDEINLQGGIKGHKIEFIVEDNLSELKNTVTVFNKLVNFDKVVLILGPNWSEFVQVVAPLAKLREIPVIAASGYIRSIFKEGSYLFSSWFPEEVTTKPFAEEIAKQKFNRLCVLTTSIAYHDEITDVVEKNLQAFGIQYYDKQTFNPDFTDFRSSIVRLKSIKCDGVFANLSHDGSISSFLIQAKQLNFVPTIFTSNNLPLDKIISQNKSIAEGVIYFGYEATPESFVQKYKDKFKVNPEPSAIFAYDNVYFVKQVLEKCSNLDGISLRKCVLETNYKGDLGELSFDSSGKRKITRSWGKVFQVKNGNFEELK